MYNLNNEQLRNEIFYNPVNNYCLIFYYLQLSDMNHIHYIFSIRANKQKLLPKEDSVITMWPWSVFCDVSSIFLEMTLHSEFFW